MKNKKFDRNIQFSIGELHFSIELLMFYTKNCVFLRSFIVFKIVHLNFHLPNCTLPAPPKLPTLQCCAARPGREVAKVTAAVQARGPEPRTRTPYGKWKLNGIILKTTKNLRKKHNFSQKVRISIDNCSFPRGKLHFSIEILLFYMENYVFLGFLSSYIYSIQFSFTVSQPGRDSHF